MNELSPGFEAYAFNPALGSEVAAGTIFVDRWKFRFESETVTLEIPASSLQVELGEGEDERIYFRDPTQPDWKIYTADFSILEHPSLAQAGQIRERVTKTATRRELSRRVKILFWFLGVCVLITWLGSIVTGLMVRSLVARIPAEWEEEFGKSVIEEIQEENKFLDDSNKVAQVEALVEPLTRVLPPVKTGFRFHIMEDEDPNALALPGGHVLLTTGLLKLIDRPEELLGVIAHETAHVTQKHSFRKIIAQGGPFLIIAIFLRGGGGMLDLLGAGSGLMVAQTFSQEFETEADDVGWNYLVAANIDPRGMTDALAKLNAYEARQKKRDSVPSAFRSHPATDKRIARLEGKWKKLARKDGFLGLKPLQPIVP